MWTLGLAALVALPAGAAQPFGTFDGLAVGGNATHGIASLVGWALHDVDVEYIDIYVDGIVVGRATGDRSSPGVAVMYPTYPDSDIARWGFELDTTAFLNGDHVLSAFVRATTGESAWLEGPTIEFLNTAQDLRPFGDINVPLPNTELFGRCDPTDPIRRFSVIDGFAVDAGLENVDTGVKWVQLLINGTLLYDTKRDCEYIPLLGGLTNCYGLPNQSTEIRFPGLPDAPHAGFRFVLDVGNLVAAGYSQGHHRIEIRAGDNDDQVRIFGTRTVVFLCDDFIGNEGAFGWLNRPQLPAFSSGAMLLRGWALDWEGIASIRLLVDGLQVGTVFPSELRPQVSLQYPGFPNSALPGWTLSVDTTNFSNGRHFAQAIVVDLEGDETIIGERFFDLQNPSP
jgi:hypothetical protein